MSRGLTTPFNVQVAGDGPRTLVLHHGFGTTGAAWRGHVDALHGAGYRTVLFDAAGSGPDTAALFHAKRHASLLGFAEDLVELLDALGVRDADFVGHSVGGMIGILAANGEPGLFRTLCLIGASACYLDEPASGYVGGFTRAAVGELIAGMRLDYAGWVNGFAPVVARNAQRPHLVEEFSRSLLTLRPDIAASVLETILLADHREDARRAALPALVVQTARDPAVPLASAQWLAAALGAGPPVIIDTDGHFPHLSAPGAVSRALLDFLARHAPT